MVYKFFDKKSASGSGTILANKFAFKNMSNEQLAKELHKPMIRKFKKRHLKNVYSSIKDNIWGAYLSNMQLISKFNKGIRFLLCIIDIFSKYA